jgi:4-amino-4-deoxy-L-arabinose transferase-like glycosyltransferase
VLIVTFISHAYHMFFYPLYLGDEGIYMEQAWVVLKGAGLTPYTYTYDHAPAGWILIAAWLRLLPRGIAQWGMAENSGRVLMLLLALASTFLLYRLARRLSGSDGAATLASLVFALSPLSLYYGRMVLLDNIMVFWLLLAFELAADGRGLFALIGSGSTFGIAMLTKENAVFFLPVLAYALYAASRRHAFYRFGVAGWLYIFLGLISLYPLYALLKGELFPGASHVSLWTNGILWQLGRTTSHGSILNLAHSPPGGFWYYYRTAWADKDPIILVAGTAATIVNLLIGLRRPDLRQPLVLAAALAIAYALYIVRGAVLLEFYIVPLLPFLALNIALAAHTLTRAWPRAFGSAVLIAAAAVLAVVFTQVEHRGRDAFAVQQTFLQADQLSYVRQHIPTGAIIMSDDDVWADLHSGDNGQYPVYPRDFPYTKVADDPAVNGFNTSRATPIDQDWRNIQYVVASNKMWGPLRATPSNVSQNLAQEAYRHSVVIWSEKLGGVLVQVCKVEPDASLEGPPSGQGWCSLQT